MGWGKCTHSHLHTIPSNYGTQGIGKVYPQSSPHNPIKLCNVFTCKPLQSGGEPTFSVKKPIEQIFWSVCIIFPHSETLPLWFQSNHRQPSCAPASQSTASAPSSTDQSLLHRYQPHEALVSVSRVIQVVLSCCRAVHLCGKSCLRISTHLLPPLMISSEKGFHGHQSFSPSLTAPLVYFLLIPYSLTLVLRSQFPQ